MVASSMLLALVVASAAAPRPAEVAAARQLAREGFRLAAAGDCAAAVEPLTRAEALFHTPTVLVRMAECHLTLGKLVLGTEGLRRVTVEDLGPAPSRAFVAARARARALLPTAEARLGHLLVATTGPEPRQVTLALDGEPLAAALLGVDIPVDPGPHRVRAEAPGYRPAEVQVELAEGGRERVQLDLAAVPVEAPGSEAVGPRGPPLEARRPAASPPPETARPETSAPLPGARVAALAALVVGGVGLGVGGGFGVAALTDRARLDAVCVSRLCPESSRSNLAALHRDATLSTVGWVVGGAGAVAALVLYLVPVSPAVAWLRPTPDGLVARW